MHMSANITTEINELKLSSGVFFMKLGGGGGGGRGGAF